MSYQQPQHPAPAPDQRQVQVTEHSRPAASGLRVFQLLAAVAGGFLFVVGLVAVFRVEFSAGFFQVSAAVLDLGFSPAMAVAAILLGGATLVATLADQDRGSAAFIGLLTLLVGVAALVLEGEAVEGVQVDRGSALLFVAVGAAVFVLSLVPWFAGRRRVTRVG